MVDFSYIVDTFAGINQALTGTAKTGASLWKIAVWSVVPIGLTYGGYKAYRALRRRSIRF